MTTLADIRAKYPGAYDDMDDEALASALHLKFYSDMPRDEFDAKIGLQPAAKEVDMLSDVIKSGGIGVVQGGIGLATLPGNVEALGRMGINAVGNLAGAEGPVVSPDTVLPNYSDAKGAVEKYTGKFYEPQTTAGKYARTIGEFLPGGTTGAGLVSRAARVAVPAIASETAGQMTEGTELEPWARLAAGVGAYPAMGAAARPIRRARANMGEQGAYGQIADSLPNGVERFADDVAAGASRGNVATNRRTLDILGEEMQRAGGDVQVAQQATINRIVAETGVTPQTARGQIRRLTQVHADSDLLLGEYPAVSGSNAAQRARQPGNVDLDALGRTENSQTQATLDYLANNGNARSAIETRNAINARQEHLGPAMREALEELPGAPRQPTGARTTRPANITDVEQHIEDARRLGGQEYRAAYNGPINNRISLHFLPRVLEGNLNRAAGRAGEPAAAIRRAVDQFYLNLPTGQRVAMNTLQQLQDARGAVRGQIAEYHRAGRDDLVGAVQPLYRQVTTMMERMSPQWAVANRRWADMRFDELAQELGDAFATKAGPRYREQLRDFHRMAPEAQGIVRIHFLQQLFDKLDNLGDTHSVFKLFSNDHSRNMIRQLFGDEAAVSFTRAVRDQKVAETSQRMLANSATHRRGMAQRQADAETGLVAAVENANARGVRNWLLERATQLVTERRNRPMGEILTTPLNDTAQVARHLHNMRAQQQRLEAINGQRGTIATTPASGAIPAGDTDRNQGLVGSYPGRPFNPDDYDAQGNRIR